MLKIMDVAVVVFLLNVTFAAAEEKLGVVVYPGAKYDEVMTQLSRFSPTVEAAAYRTGDSFPKVVEFYRKQGLLFLRLGGNAKERAQFKKVDRNVDVIIQSPWRDARTGAMMKDTLLTILKARQ